MSAARKEVDEPIVDFVWYIGGRHFVEQSRVPNGVKGLTEVQRDDHCIGYELHESISVTDWRMAMRAAVVNPVGRKAY